MISQAYDSSLRLEKIGSGQSAQVVYLPSIIGENKAIEFVDALANILPDITISVLEYPGCGSSTSSEGAWKSIPDAVYALGRLLDALTDGPVVLIGASLGGWLAAEAAAWYPRKVGGLVLSNSFGLRVVGLPAQSPFFEKGSADFTSSFYALANPNGRDLAEILEPSLKVEEKENPFRLFLHLLRVQTLAARIGFSPLMHDPHLQSRLPSIECPSLVLWGEADGIVTPEFGQAFATQIPNGKLVVDATSGHFPLLEKPQEHARTVAEFISQLSTYSR